MLPVVGRELRVAARKRSTFWVRVAAPTVALVIGIGFFILLVVPFFGFGAAGVGRRLFATLTWLSFAGAWLAGLFFTSDSLSEEKREGTMGFLFLTDLRGYDVVLGKLLATSLRSFYALLAVCPILGVALLMGGVAGTQFWKTVLALVNALFLSLAAGLFISAISRESQKALGATFLLLALLAAGGPVIDLLIANLRQGPFDPVFTLTSPVYLFAMAQAWGRTPFWQALLVNQVIAWLLLAFSAIVLPRTWQEKASRTANASWARWWKFGGVKRQLALRHKLIGVNPVLWLACRERWQALALWIIALTVAGGAAATLWASTEPGVWLVWQWLGGAVTLLIYVLLTSQACRLFVEGQRNGAIELLLVSPLSEKKIVHGQWRALLRMFAVPVALYLAVQLVAAVMASETWKQLAASVPVTAIPAPGTGGTNSNVVVVTNTTVITTTGGVTVTGPGWSLPSAWVMLATSIAGVITTATNLVALIWFGMWMGLTSRNTNVATLKTIAFVQIIPWFAISFASAMLVPFLLMPQLMRGGAGAPTQMMTWYPLLTTAVTTILYLCKDIGFVLWARWKLYADFRQRAAGAFAPPRRVTPPLPQTAAPPVIASA